MNTFYIYHDLASGDKGNCKEFHDLNMIFEKLLSILDICGLGYALCFTEAG